MEDYRKTGKKAYGEVCEFDGCGWSDASCDVHHIDYQEQQAMERMIRSERDTIEFYRLTQFAKEQGWGDYDRSTRQLGKNDDISNLAVLCPNHHRYVHTKDLGLKVLENLPPRKSSL
jgi:hypothetical protein